MIVSDERAARFVSEALGVGFVPPYTALALEKDGKIVAGVLFNVFEAADVHVSIAGTGWTRDFVRAVGEYVYGTLDYERMTFVTEHEAVADFAKRLGGQVEGLLRNHFGKGRDALIGSILRDEWRYGSKITLAHG